MRVLGKIPYPRVLAAAAAGFVLYLLAGFLLAPWAVERAVPGFVEDRLQRKATVGAVRFNPLLFKAEVDDFELAERDGAPIAGFRRLQVDFDLSSIVRRAWTFSGITLEGLDVKADIAPGGRFNIAALLDDLAGPGPREGGPPPRLLLRHVVLRDGAIAFSDRSNPTPAATSLGPIDIELRDISTLAERRGTYSVSARLAEGGNLRWRGEISLAPLSSQGEIAIQGVKPLTAWRFLQDELGLAEPRGEFDISARYRVAYARGAPQAVIEGARFSGRDVALTLSGTESPMLSLSAIEVTDGRFDLATRALVIPGVELRGGAVAVEVDAGGAVNWQKLVKAGAGGKAAQQDATPSRKPWTAQVELLRVADVGLDYTDRSRAKPIRMTAKDVSAELAATVEMREDGLHALLEKIGLTLTRLTAGEAAPAEPLAVLDTVKLENGSFNLSENRIGIGRLAVDGGAVQVTRDRSGAIPILDLFSTEDAGLVRREVADALKQAEAEGHPWRVAVDALEVAGTRVALSDHGFGAPVEYDLQDLRARVGGFRSDGKEPVRLDATLRFAQGGTLSVNGAFRLSGEQAEGRVRLNRVNLKPLHPVIASRTRAVLASGELSGDVRAQYRLRGKRHVIRASGPVSVDNLLLNEAEGGDRLLAWKALSTDSVRLSLDPDELRIGEARIVGLGAKIVVFKDRSVNLAKAATIEAGTADASVAPAAPAAPAPPATLGDTEPLFLVNIGRVSVEGGAVEFSDLSLVLPFAANVKELNGVVQGVSTDRDSRASVRLDGRVDEYGLARVEGSLRPFRPKSFLDLAVTFRNVEMPPLSPYTVTFAGRRIASGRLALDLRYKIDNSMLSGDNRVVLEKFTLGERVETPGAAALPLDLAVALLTDSQGRIDLAVPVSGNVDDPQFSYGHLVWQAIKNVLTSIVTAPFRALGAIFGGGSGGENLESIAFDPGRAVLLPPEREKLKLVAEGIARRPQLKLVAEGQYGAADLAALRQRDVEAAVSTRLRRPTAADATTEPVNVTEARTQRALEAIFIERNSEAALDRFSAETGKSRGKPVERVNAALALVGRGSADREFYEALLKRLVETAPVPDDAPRQLADARAHAVAGYLVGDLAVPGARVAAKAATEPGEARVKFAFDVADAAAVPTSPPAPETPASPR